MNGQAGIVDRYLDLFDKNIGKIMDSSSPYINSLREPAYQSFRRMGIPDKKNENYKFADLALFFDFDYKTRLNRGKATLKRRKTPMWASPILETQGMIL